MVNELWQHIINLFISFSYEVVRKITNLVVAWHLQICIAQNWQKKLEIWGRWGAHDYNHTAAN